MAIPPIELPDLKLDGLSDADKAALNSFLAEIIDVINAIREIVNVNHP